MHAVHADLSLGEWLQFASLHLDRDPYQTSDPSGIVGIEGGSGYLHGILVFRVVSELRHGRTLRCEHIVVANLFREDEVAEALIEAIHRLARVNDFAAVTVSLDDPSSVLKTCLEGAGLSEGTTIFYKPITPIQVV